MIHFSTGLKAALDDLIGLFQPELFYNSINRLNKWNNFFVVTQWKLYIFLVAFPSSLCSKPFFEFKCSDLKLYVKC